MPELESGAVTGDKDLDYDSCDESFDEMVLDDGGMRPHWQTFVDKIEAIGLPELRQRWEEAKLLIRENGVTYNVYGDPQGMDRPWELDPIPLVLSPADAASIEAGLTQRARLLDLVLSDLYGPRTLLTGGALPPPLGFGQPRHLRPCHRTESPLGRSRHLQCARRGLGRRRPL